MMINRRRLVVPSSLLFTLSGHRFTSVEGEKTMDVRKQITQWAKCYVNGLRTVFSIFCLPALGIALSLLASSSAASQELVRLRIFGGYGGNNFEYICGPGRVLVGVRGYAGVWIDNVQAVCAKVESPRDFGQPEGPVFGGNRPITNSSVCAAGTVATGLEADVNKHNRFLGYIAPRCTVLFSGSFLQKPMPMRGTGLLASNASDTTGSELFVKPVGQECPADMVAVGIHGRAGQFLDALGLVCGPKPAPHEGNRRTLGKRKRDTGTLIKRKLRTSEQSTEVSQPVRQPAGEPVMPPLPAPPFITANPADVVVAAGQTQGTTMLTWDGGNDHPYAEVWVKVDRADETFIVEQGQGTRQATIERGKTYLFILTDAGQRLATVTVTVKP